MNISLPIDSAIEFINIVELSPLVSHCNIKVCWVDNTHPNRNGSLITKEVATKMGQTLAGCPIVGYFNEETQDFAGHERQLVVDEDGNVKLKDITRPYGFVDVNAKVWFQKFQDNDGVIREYLCTEGYIWTGAYPESKRIIEQGNNQSMELEKESVQGFWTNQNNSNARFFIINEALIEKLCILGENVEPCFEGSQIKNTFSLEAEFAEFKNTMFSLISEIKETLKGGAVDMQEENVIIEDTVVTEEPVTENSIADPAPEVPETPVEETQPEPEVIEEAPVAEEPVPVVEEPVTEEPAGPTYSLEEIPEYVSLRDEHNTLLANYSALEESVATLNAELETLRTFRLEKEREAKQSMINSFYMLSDEDKKDVIENIDNYSLNDIEAKLAVICVRNKVNFSLNENKLKTEEPALLFNLNSVGEDNVPDWVKAVREVASNM